MKKILFVDDEADFVALMSDLIEVLDPETNYKILHAATADEAVQIADRNCDIEIVFMDGCLHPESRTVDTLDLVRMIQIHCPKATLIASSSNPDSNSLLLKAGCDRSIPKQPSKGRELTSALSEVLGLKKQEEVFA